jgi:phage/plasmid-associated DNA primase
VDLDSVTEFLTENTEEKLGSRLPIKQLFERYKEWCEINLKHPESNNGFSKRARWYFDTHMKGKVKPFRTNKDRGYEGVQLC